MALSSPLSPLQLFPLWVWWDFIYPLQANNTPQDSPFKSKTNQVDHKVQGSDCTSQSTQRFTLSQICVDVVICKPRVISFLLSLIFVSIFWDFVNVEDPSAFRLYYWFDLREEINSISCENKTIFHLVTSKKPLIFTVINVPDPDILRECHCFYGRISLQIQNLKISVQLYWNYYKDNWDLLNEMFDQFLWVDLIGMLRAPAGFYRSFMAIHSYGGWTVIYGNGFFSFRPQNCLKGKCAWNRLIDNFQFRPFLRTFHFLMA